MPFQSSSLTQLFNGLLRRGAKDNIKKVLDDMIEEAQAWKPSDMTQIKDEGAIITKASTAFTSETH